MDIPISYFYTTLSITFVLLVFSCILISLKFML